MPLITVKNKSVAVKVLKSLGLQPMRLFPGYNLVDEGELKQHLKSKVGKAFADESLRPVDSPSKDQEREAKKAAKKNAELNKAKKVISANNKIISDSKDQISKQDKIIADQDKELKALNKRLAALEKK